jgi:Protein of unknown function (DUF3352)
MNNVRPFAVLVLAALSLAVGCGKQISAEPAGAALAPATAPVFVSIRTDSGSGQWQQARDLIDKFPDGDRAIGWALDQLGARGLDFQRDVEPALGPETDIVGLDLTGEGEFVGLTQPDDAQKLHEVLAKLEQSLVTREIDGWTAFAASDEVLDRFESLRKNGTLADSSDFEDAIGEVDGEALVRVYMNGDALRTAIEQQGEVPSGASFPTQVSSLALSLGAEEDAVKLEGAALLTDEAGDSVPDNFKADLPEEVPGGALAYVGFNDLERAFSALRDSLAESDPNFDRDLARIEAELGVSLEEDVFPLFADEAALYVRPGFIIPEVTLVTHVEDEQAAMATVGKLVHALAEYVPAAQQVTDVDIDGIPAKEVPIRPPVSIFWAAFDGHLVLSTSRDGIAELRRDDDRLADDADFKAALEQAGMPDETNGFVYVNLHKAIPYVLSLVGDVPAEVRRNLEPLDNLVLYSSKDGKTLKFAGHLGVD